MDAKIYNDDNKQKNRNSGYTILQKTNDFRFYSFCVGDVGVEPTTPCL